MKTKPTNPIGSSMFKEIGKTRCSNLVRFLSLLNLAIVPSRSAAV